jgi:hypothetical protein
VTPPISRNHRSRNCRWNSSPSSCPAAPRNQITRIGTGRDATDVAFATIFATAQLTKPSPTVRVLEQSVEDVAAAIATA